jgi:hypothetical protein
VEFGLLPEFSTPVQKPVEIAGVLSFGTKMVRDLLHFREAKVQKRRFEATLGVAVLKAGGFAGRS